MQKQKVLITSPSLRTENNISGISTLVANIIELSIFHPRHFVIGSRDNEKKNAGWFLKQHVIFIRFFKLSYGNRYNVLHLNTGLEKFSIIRDSFISIIAQAFGKKILLHVHGGYYLMNNADGKLLKWCLQRLFLNASLIVVLSEREREELTARFGALNFKVLANAVKTECATAPNYVSNKAIENKAVLKVIFLGRIHRSKGIFTIAESFKYMQGYFSAFRFEVYGTGPDLDKFLEALYKVEQLDFEYKGITDSEEKWNILNDADVFVLPSVDSEGLPVAMIEAMASACTVIVTDDASVTTVVENNVNGLVVPKNSPIVLANKLKEIIDGKIDIETMGMKARKYVTDHLNFKQYIEKLDNIYQQI